jgi:type I restriction enzyme, S subunit
MKYKTYSKMKDSGIGWIGEIPEHWQVVDLKYLSNKIVVGFVGSIKSDYTKDTKIPLLRTTNIKNGKLNLSNLKYITDEFHFKNIKSQLRENDIIIARHGNSGASALITDLEEANCLNVVVVRSNSKKINPKYLVLILNSIISKTFLEYEKFGGVQNIVNTEDIANIPIVCSPKIKEQEQITKFLENELDKIDSKILKNQKLMKSIKEKKESIINHAVTKGIDLNVTMKDSRIDRIGRIPEDWSKSSLRQAIKSIKSGVSRSLSTEDIGFPVLRSTNIINSKLKLSEIKYWYKEDTKGVNLNEYILEDKDIILNFINSMAQIGKSSLFVKQDRDWIYTTNNFRIKINIDKLVPEYFIYFLNSHYMRELIFSISQPAVNQASFTKDDLKQLSIVYPNLSTQNKIIVFLDKQTTKIDSYIFKMEIQTQKLEEYRQSLISSVITGKICVTN